MRDWQLTQFVDKNVVFVGAGRGRAMTGIQQLLEQYAAIKSFVGVDKHDNEIDPLAFLKEYNPAQTIFIKNEGIPGHELSVPYTTPLQLFFQLVPTTKAITIGITGTKGKSTTTALTAHILEAAGKQVVLAGNNGISPFPALDTATADTIFVFELSSYQLSDVTMSPHISACLNLYNDHSDWHTSRERYWEAKHNIMRFAGKDDVFIYNPEYPALREWAEAAHCQTKAIDTTEMIDMKTAELFGEHNRLNAF
jgi:UDP-N-acetylmuramoylalanine-D-glutamate ligase